MDRKVCDEMKRLKEKILCQRARQLGGLQTDSGRVRT